MFSKGIAMYPDNPKFYRHRGHRYISIRQFAKAQADFEKAAQLIKGKPDEIEPDGAPNPAGKPRSTLQFNIWYHLALSHYLQGNYAKAYDAQVECMKVSTNDDSIVATSDWMWMTLMRLNRKADAAKVLERITPKMDILENQAYHRRLLMYKGIEKPEALLDTASPDPTQIATQGYGVANYYFVMGDTREGATGVRKDRLGRGLECVRLHRRRSGFAADEVAPIIVTSDQKRNRFQRLLRPLSRKISGFSRGNRLALWTGDGILKHGQDRRRVPDSRRARRVSRVAVACGLRAGADDQSRHRRPRFVDACRSKR